MLKIAACYLTTPTRLDTPHAATRPGSPDPLPSPYLTLRHPPPNDSSFNLQFDVRAGSAGCCGASPAQNQTCPVRHRASQVIANTGCARSPHRVAVPPLLLPHPMLHRRMARPSRLITSGNGHHFSREPAAGASN